MTEPRSARRRAPDALPLLLPLDPAAATPLHRQVYDGLRDAILDGRFAPGARLPSTRALAADLGLARNTVTLAFEQLRTEGYLEGHRGGGSRVRDVPDEALHVGPPRGAARRALPVRAPATPPQHSTAVAERPRDAAQSPARLSRRGAALAAAGARLGCIADAHHVPFRTGVPALDAFPVDDWVRLSTRRWRRRGGVLLGEGAPAGEPELREAIAEYLRASRGARCTAAQVVVVSGTQQAFDLLARVLLDAGDAVWMEDPGYMGARAALESAGARVVSVPVDADGLVVSAGERLEPRARMAVVTPSHQFPLGSVMCAGRRLALLDWAQRAGAWIVEDDYDSEFRYAGRPLPCLQGLEAERLAPGQEARVAYIGTFSKTLAPGLRVAYLVLPAGIAAAVADARGAVDRHVSTFEQGVLADFLREGHYARHVRRMRTLYAARQASLLELARTELGARLALAPDPAGLHLVGHLPAGIRDADVAAAARALGVEVATLSRYFAGPPDDAPQGLILGYAAFTAEEMRAALRRLREAIDGCA